MSLKTVYQPYFKMGAAVPAQVFESTTALGELCVQYDSMTCENEMKPQFLLDEEENRRNAAQYDRCPAVCFEGVRKYLDFAREHGMKMRGHTLVWHNQTPDGFLQKGTAGKRMLPLRTGRLCLLGWRGIYDRYWNLPKRNIRELSMHGMW